MHFLVTVSQLHNKIQLPFFIIQGSITERPQILTDKIKWIVCKKMFCQIFDGEYFVFKENVYNFTRQFVNWTKF